MTSALYIDRSHYVVTVTVALRVGGLVRLIRALCDCFTVKISEL